MPQRYFAIRNAFDFSFNTQKCSIPNYVAIAYMCKLSCSFIGWVETPIKFKTSKVPIISLGNHLTSSYFEKTSLFMLLFCVYCNDKDPGENSGHSVSRKAKNSTEQATTVLTNIEISPRRSDLSRPWPMGKYCMFKLHDKDCPSGLTEGEDTSHYLPLFFNHIPFPSSNLDLSCTSCTSYISGVISMSLALHHPSKLLDINAINGEDAKNKTKISFCCSSSGDAEQEIILPRLDPFYLLPSSNQNCQKVINRVLSLRM